MRVSAATRLELFPELADDALRIRGVLLDDLDAPVAGKPIQLRVEAIDGSADARRVVRTDAEGTFTARLPAQATRYRVRASFDGDGEHGPSESERPVERQRVALRLSFLEPAHGRLDLDRVRVQVALRASSARGGQGVHVRILDALGGELARGVTDEAGLLQLQLPTRELGPPGTGTWIAQSEADAERAAAQTELSVLRQASTQLTLEHASLLRDGVVTIVGRLRTRTGGLADKAVGLYLEGGEHLASVVTDADGRYRFSGAPPSPEPASEPPQVYARFDSDAPWLRSSQSQPRQLVPLQAAPSRAWLLFPLLACALLLWWMARRERGEPGPDTARISFVPSPGVRPGARSRARATLREVSGTVRSADPGRPLGQAQAVIVGADGTSQRLRVDARGRFQSGPLASGVARLRLSAPAFADSEVEIAIPHRGEWSSLVAHLDSLRTAALRVFDRAAGHVAGEPVGLAQVTPREAVAAAERRTPRAASLRQLAMRVERAAFAQPPPSSGELTDIIALANQLEREPPAGDADRGTRRR